MGVGGGGAGVRKEGLRPLAVREEGCGGGPFPVLPTPDHYALASLSKHLLAHSRLTLLSLPKLYTLGSSFRRTFPLAHATSMVEVVEEGLAKKLAKGASELKFLLTQHKVSADIQGELYENGIDTVARFAAAATDEADLKAMLKDSFSINPSESLKLRAQAAGVVVAWKTAISRVERQAEAEATNEVRDLAKPIPSTDYIAMRQAFAAKFGELEDKHIPAKEYIEKKLAELESGEFRAEPLTEIISRDEVDPDTLLPHWDAKGTISLRKGGSKTAMPSGPEQLRLRLTVLQNTLVMIQLRHPGRRELEDVNFALFEKYKDFKSTFWGTTAMVFAPAKTQVR